MDPRVISLDIETYGKHSSYPEQTCFAPSRSLFVDKPRLEDLVLTCAITIPAEDPRCQSPLPSNAAPSAPAASTTTSPARPAGSGTSLSVPSASTPSTTSTPNAAPTSPAGSATAAASGTPPPTAPTAAWNGMHLSLLKPGPTLVLRLSEPKDRAILAKWLAYADTIIGMNLQFDLSYLRAFSGIYAHLLSPFSKTLIDLSVVNYLECESRPEKSLKNLGPILGTHIYRPEDLERLDNWPAILNYNASDTHNTILAVSALARRILHNPHRGDKLSPFCLQFYSDTIWSCVHMTEAGVPFHHPSLVALFNRLALHVSLCERLCSPLQLSGPGSDKSKQSFLRQCIDACPGPSPLDDPLLEMTPKTREISWSDANRSLLLSYLTPSHPLSRKLRAATLHSRAQKLLSTYLFPYLLGDRKTLTDRTSVLCPIPGVLPCPFPSIPPALSQTTSLPPKKKRKRKTAPKKTSPVKMKRVKISSLVKMSKLMNPTPKTKTTTPTPTSTATSTTTPPVPSATETPLSSASSVP